MARLVFIAPAYLSTFFLWRRRHSLCVFIACWAEVAVFLFPDYFSVSESVLAILSGCWQCDPESGRSSFLLKDSLMRVSQSRSVPQRCCWRNCKFLDVPPDVKYWTKEKGWDIPDSFLPNFPSPFAWDSHILSKTVSHLLNNSTSPWWYGLSGISDQ